MKILCALVFKNRSVAQRELRTGTQDATVSATSTRDDNSCNIICVEWQRVGKPWCLSMSESVNISQHYAQTRFLSFTQSIPLCNSGCMHLRRFQCHHKAGLGTHRTLGNHTCHTALHQDSCTRGRIQTVGEICREETATTEAATAARNLCRWWGK